MTETVIAGEDFRKYYTVYDSPTQQELDNLTNATLDFELFTSDRRRGEYVSAGHAEVSNGETAEVSVWLTPEETEELKGRVLHYRLWLRYSGDAGSYVIDSGKIVVQPL